MLGIVRMNCKIIIFLVTWILAILLLTFSCFLWRRKRRTAFCITDAAVLRRLAHSWASCWMFTMLYSWRNLLRCDLARNHLCLGWMKIFIISGFKYIHTHTHKWNKQDATLNIFQPSPVAFLFHSGWCRSFQVTACECKCVHVNSTLHSYSSFHNLYKSHQAVYYSSITFFT